MNQIEIQKKKKIALGQIIVSSVLFSTGGFLIKLVPWPALAISGGRSLISMMGLAAYILYSGMEFRFGKKAFLQAGCMGATLTLYVAATKMTTAANAIVLQYVSPVFILLLGVLFLHQKPRKADWIVVAMTMCGIGLFFFEQLSTDGMIGNCLAILSGLCLASLYLLCGEIDEDERFTGMMLGHGLTFLIGLPTMVTAELEFSPVAILGILTLGIFQICLPYVFLAKAMNFCTPLTCNLVGVLEPLLNPVWVFFVTGEIPGTLALIGGAVIVTSVTVWCYWGDKQDKKEIQR